jgi:hypothetical protein
VLPTPGARVQIAIDPGGLEVAESSGREAAALTGRIDSVEQRRDRCRLRVRLACGQALRADITLAEYQQTGANLGSEVALSFAASSVRLV